jgi:hypothetical protein
MTTFPITKELADAIRILYPGNDTGLLALGIIGLTANFREPQRDPETPYKDRVSELSKWLQDGVMLNAHEIDEFEGEYDLNRIRFEARDKLLVLRELHRLFPEVIQ